MNASASLVCDQFRRSGYYLAKQVFTSRQCEAARTQIQRDMSIEAGPLRRSPDGAVRRLDAVYQRGGIYAAFATEPSLLDLLASFLGPNIVLTTNRHNHATVTGIGHPPDRLHRDVLQWSRTIITAIAYLEESTVANGCTHLIPGSHLLPFVGTPNNGGTWMDEHSQYSPLIGQELPIPAQMGDVLIFDSLAFHRAGRNAVGGDRTSLTFGYHSVDELSLTDSTRKPIVLGEHLYRGNDA